MDAKNTPQGVIIASEFTIRVSRSVSKHHSTIFELNVESYRRRVAARTPRKPRGVSDSKSDSVNEPD